MTSYLHVHPSPLGHSALISMRPATCAVPPAEVLHRQTYERVTCVYNIYYVRALAPFGCKGTTFIWNTQGFRRFFLKKNKPSLTLRLCAFKGKRFWVLAQPLLGGQSFATSEGCLHSRLESSPATAFFWYCRYKDSDAVLHAPCFLGLPRHQNTEPSFYAKNSAF